MIPFLRLDIPSLISSFILSLDSCNPSLPLPPPLPFPVVDCRVAVRPLFVIPIDCCVISVASYWPKQSAERKTIFFGVSDDADGDSEANGPRQKLPVIATSTLTRTSAVGGFVGSSTAAGVTMSLTINPDGGVELLLFSVVVLRRRFERRLARSIMAAS